MKVGDTITLKHNRRYRAIIVLEMPDIAEGAVMLNKRIDGFRNWNKDALELVKSRKRTKEKK